MAEENAGGGAELKLKLAETEQLLAQAREALDATERKRQIERELWQEGAVDVETAAMLTEAAVAGMDKKDVRAAIGELKRRKPFLFRTGGKTGGVMGGQAASDGLGAAAAEARESGDRRALLRYLRLRRGG